MKIISQDDIQKILERPVTEPADQIAAQACNAEILERRAALSEKEETIAPKLYAAFHIAAATTTIEKYGFGKRPEMVSGKTAPSESAAYLALRLAVAEMRDEMINTPSGKQAKSGPARLLKAVFSHLTEAAPTQEDESLNFLKDRLEQYGLGVGDADLRGLVEHADRSADILLMQDRLRVMIREATNG